MVTDDIVLALAIFSLRVVNNAMGTVRVLLISRQRMWAAAILGFFESIIFAFTVANVVSDLTNPLILGAYAGGFSVGGYIGMLLERRFVASFSAITVMVKANGHELAEILRDKGFGVTETIGEGRDGAVAMLRSVVDRRIAKKVIDEVRASHPEAFITVEETRTIPTGIYPFRAWWSPLIIPIQE